MYQARYFRDLETISQEPAEGQSFLQNVRFAHSQAFTAQLTGLRRMGTQTQPIRKDKDKK